MRGRLHGLSAGALRPAPGTCAHMLACEQLMGGNGNLSLLLVQCRLHGLSADALRLAAGTCAHMRACKQSMGGQRITIAVNRLHRVSQHLHEPPRCVAGTMLTRAMQSLTNLIG